MFKIGRKMNKMHAYAIFADGLPERYWDNNRSNFTVEAVSWVLILELL